jgi:hypothetical protein
MVLALTILRYLEKHPDAKDTLEGIEEWWLLREGTKGGLAEVESAVSFLLSKDLLVETRREGLPPYFQLNQNKQSEVSRILAKNRQ